MLQIVPETPAVHAAAIETLFDATFGPGHFAKTAERLREFSRSLPEISRVAVLDRGGGAYPRAVLRTRCRRPVAPGQPPWSLDNG